HQCNPDPMKKDVFALADGQICYGPLSLFEYNNHLENKRIGYENVKMIDNPLECKEYFIIDNPTINDVDVIEIDAPNGIIYIKEMPLKMQMITSAISPENLQDQHADEQSQTAQIMTPSPASNSKQMRLQQKTCSNTDLICRSRPNFQSGSISDDDLVGSVNTTPLKLAKHNCYSSQKQSSTVLSQSAVVKRVTGQHLHLLTPLRSALQPSKICQKVTRITSTDIATPLNTVRSTTTTPVNRKGIKSSGYGQRQPATIASFRRATPLTRK
ncbi:unnamed protein product, partial [Didymodactylos carnosus]